ncbi:MAG: pentapeptide repeat-containing protein [Deltaproteobacteria bacterium]|nr:pentapeptide repeat-containing protein [Deltaproteobacteria bacterium]
MVDEDHVMILRCGERIWNRWREENVEIKPDLSYSYLGNNDLRGADLTEVNLSNSTLFYADLREVNFSNANLSSANLGGADLSSVDLKRANLTEANLTEANLTEANFFEADLSKASLLRARFSGADFTGANLAFADFRGADLSSSGLKDINLLGADLSDANLTDADLANVNLSYAFLGNANLAGARLEAVVLELVKAGPPSALPAILERAYIGEPLAALSVDLFRLDLPWKTCFMGDRADFDPGHNPEDSSYWLARQGKETIFDAVIRKLAGSLPNSIHLTFQESAWLDLIIIETALRTLFGSDLETKKTDVALTVRFQSMDDLQRGLDATLLLLAVKHLQGSQDAGLLALQGEDEHLQSVTNEDLYPLISAIGERLEGIEKDVSTIRRGADQSIFKRILIELFKKIPAFGSASPWLEDFLAGRELRQLPRVPVKKLVRLAQNGFRWSSEARRLQEADSATSFATSEEKRLLGNGVEDAEILEEQAEGRLLGDGREEE